MIPDRSKVEQIVQGIARNPDGTPSTVGVQHVFAKLLGLTTAQVEQDHAEVLAFQALTSEQMVEKLFVAVAPERVDAYVEVMPSATNSFLLPRIPDRLKLERILRSTEQGWGKHTGSDVKVLFGNLLGIDQANIPDNHQEVLDCAKMSANQFIEKLLLAAQPERVESYYEYLFPVEPVDRPKELISVFSSFDSVEGAPSCLRRDQLLDFLSRLAATATASRYWDQNHTDVLLREVALEELVQINAVAERFVKSLVIHS